MTLIELHALTKIYEEGNQSIPVLRGINLRIESGERIALLGKSGSGKSTLLNLIGGLDRMTSGQMLIEGNDFAKFNTTELARHRQHTVGMIFQSFHLIPSQTALENVELPLIFAGCSRELRREKAMHALESVGLSQRMEHRPNQLSGGERQRVAIARALVNRPRVILADEPTGNLDSITGSEIIDLLLNRLQEDRATFILVTHDEELARRVAHRILRMNDGLIREESQP